MKNLVIVVLLFLCLNCVQNSDELGQLMSAARQGDPYAQYVIAGALIEGDGIEKDCGAGIRWLRLSADNGYDIGQMALAKMYCEGICLEVDQEAGMRWYVSAANQGRPSVQRDVARVFLMGACGTKDYVEAYRWIWLAGGARSETLRKLESMMTETEQDRAKRLILAWVPTETLNKEIAHLRDQIEVPPPDLSKPQSQK
jgi:hypothetical protein